MLKLFKKLILYGPRKISSGEYIFPVPEGVPCTIETHSPSHTGRDKYCVDFIVSEGACICAPRAGIVKEIKQDSEIGGADKSFAEHANYICIQHEDGEFSYLIHLGKNSSLVRRLQHVKQGEIIARQGSTGWTYEPHIHLGVYKYFKSLEGGITIPIRFKTGNKK